MMVGSPGFACSSLVRVVCLALSCAAPDGTIAVSFWLIRSARAFSRFQRWFTVLTSGFVVAAEVRARGRQGHAAEDADHLSMKHTLKRGGQRRWT